MAYGGQWTPATSNSFSQMALLQLRAFPDDYQEPLSSSLQNATVDSATLLGPANRRLLQQVRLPHFCSRPRAVCRDGLSCSCLQPMLPLPSKNPNRLMSVSGLSPVAQHREA